MSVPDPIEPTAVSETPVRPSWQQRPALTIAAIAALLLALQWYDNHQQMKLLQSELVRRPAGVDAEHRDSHGAAEPAREASHDVAGRLEALETLAQELSRSRDEAWLAEIEQTLLMASQQVQTTGNVRAALIALQSIDARMVRLDRPQFAGLRKALANDIDRLKLAPRLDLAAAAARLDAVAAGIDSLPLLIEARPSDAPVARKPPALSEEGPWLRFAREFWQDVRELVRIEKIDNADAAPLSASQAYFLRENLRLRLLGARFALLARDEKNYKADLKSARDWLARYFDTRKEPVAAAVATVRQLHDGAINAASPDVAASLDAVRSVRATFERR